MLNDRQFSSNVLRSMSSDEYSETLDGVARQQRGAPESAMLAAQRRLGGGVYPGVLEHAGDLPHRMQEVGGRFGTEFVKPKVELIDRTLNRRYGFEREMSENVRAQDAFNRERGQGSVSMDDVREVGHNFAQAHAALPVLNVPAGYARVLNVALGEQQFDRARMAVHHLKRIVDDPRSYSRLMSQSAAERKARFDERRGSR